MPLRGYATFRSKRSSGERRTTAMRVNKTNILDLLLNPIAAARRSPRLVFQSRHNYLALSSTQVWAICSATRALREADVSWFRHVVREKRTYPYEEKSIGKYWIQYFFREFPILFREKSTRSNICRNFFFHTSCSPGMRWFCRVILLRSFKPPIHVIFYRSVCKVNVNII